MYDDSYLKDLYQTYLGRDPDPGAQGWLDALKSGGMTPEQVHSGIVGSEEFKTRPAYTAATSYLSANPDVAEWAKTEDTNDIWDAIQHYQKHGLSEGRSWQLPATGGTTGETATEPTNFDVPTDKYPKSHSGLDETWRNQIMEVLFPELAKSITDYETNVKKRQDEAVKLYQHMIDQALKGSLKNRVTDLSRRGILGGTEAQNVLSQTARDVILGGAGKGYEAGVATADTMSRAPAMFGGLSELGRYSSSTDEGAPYRTIAALLQGLM